METGCANIDSLNKDYIEFKKSKKIKSFLFVDAVIYL